ncbi:hypothetical protein Vretimale_8139 [Volvox reticuliferus]|uniref:Conserved oligomeric Golgi complex subunit 1 n=1 Tax=Volvox reticuliferus TaxID=1737510 RepID=A0A8J4FWH1_9CHLO|nr:hypothetical protein Vretifemale_20651 [Volvox reticuliferus]GIM03409.1 hypothetical protein Vretimale_8139 [Volvox reticuliferus]
MQTGLGSGQLGPVAGQLKQPVLTDAQRGAEALFTTKTISEIREIEVRTRKDIEQKKLQLRNLVGDSYRDLIDSADKILAIANNTTTILNNVRSIQESFSSLAHNFTSSDALLNEKRDSLNKHEELYAVGSRVKYLVDTPELIWGCLDARRYLDASRRFLRAQHVHDLMASNFSPAVLAKFPLLRHHWPTVTKFKKQVVDAVQAVLLGERQMHTDLAADLLASLASLQGMDSTALLQAFLSSRRSMVGQLVGNAAPASGEDAPAAASEVLSSLAQAAQLTIAQVGELFLPVVSSGGGRGADATCLLQQCCREEADYSELLFGGRTNSSEPAAATPTTAAPEADAWRRTNRAVVERLAALSSGQVEHACVGWLRAVAEDFSAQSPRLLAGLTTAAALVEVEAHVRGAVAAWQHPGLPSATAAGQPARSTGPGAAKRARMVHSNHYPSALLSPTVPGAALSQPATPGAAAGAGDAPHLGSWESVAEWVVGRQLNVWQEIFHQPFVVRSRELIEEGFAVVGRSLDGPLDHCLRAAAEAELEPAGCIITRTWPLEGWDGTAAAGAPAAAEDSNGLARARLESVGRSTEQRAGGTSSGAIASGGTPAPGAGGASTGVVSAGRAYRQQVLAIQRKFDEDLRSILQAALLLVGTADAAVWPPGIHSTPVSASPSTASLPRVASDAATVAGAQPMMHPLLQLPHPHHHHPHHHRSSLHALATIKREMQGSRAAELEPFVQAKCIELVTAIAARLQGRLDQLGQPREGPAGAAIAEQVVLLGRLASALATDSRYLPIVLGSPEAWKAAVSAVAGPGGTSALSVGRTAGRIGGVRGTAANARLTGVLEKLRAAAVAAYRSWASWAAISLAGELRALVLADDLLCANAVPLSWQETIIVSEAENALAEPIADMRFSLPASPSVPVLLLLAAACAEVRRAGDHKIAPEALQAFEWELSRAITSTYSQLLQPGTGALHVRGVTEKGILQLLLDVRFLRDVLVGGRPVTSRSSSTPAGTAPGLGAVATAGALGGLGSLAVGLLPGVELADPALVSALTERKREAAALEQMLQDCLDPIDWATYESYLWANEARYFQRVSILFGGLIHLQRAHPEQAAKLTATGLQDSNPLNVLPVASRFQYLPISAPAPVAPQSGVAATVIATSGAAGAAATANATTTGSLTVARLRPSMAALNRGAPSSLDSLDAYSFADLGSARLGRGANTGGSISTTEAVAPLSAQSAASAGAAALSALHARLQAGSLGQFGSLLGDKAAEVTAMAQQRFGDLGFGDYLPTSALGSAGGLLSSLAKNVVKK